MRNLLTFLVCVAWTMPSWADSLMFLDDFSVQRPEWMLAVDGGYVGQPTLQGPLTQAMIDEALAGSYANISGGALNLKANTSIGNDWGAASAILNVKLPDNFRITFSSVKTQWAGHERFKFIELDPTVPLKYNPVEVKHGRAIQFSVSGSVSSDLYFEPIEDNPQSIDGARDSGHAFGQAYHYEIEKIANRLTVWRDGELQYDYSGGLTLDFVNYLGIVNLQAGATAVVDDLRIYSIARPAAIYWTDPGSAAIGADLVRKANPDGTDAQTIVSGLEEPRGLALDPINRKLYVTDLGARVIRRSNLDGSGLEPFTSVHDGAGDVVVDPFNGKVYWTDTDTSSLQIGGLSGAIRRANIDGSSVEDLVTGLIHPVAIDLDVANGKVYWTDLAGHVDGMGSIQRANLDGTSPEIILAGVDEANGLVIDSIHGKMYWTEGVGQKIQSANLDGTGVTDVLTGLESPTQIDLNLFEGKIYWTDSGGQSNRIERANLDGSGRETLVSGIGFPWGITLLPVPEPSTLMIFAIGCAAQVLLRRRPRRRKGDITAFDDWCLYASC